MSIFKRGNTWWIDFTTPRGERIRCSAQTEVRQQAQELHDKLKNEAWRTSKLKERPEYTWDEAALRWLEEKADKADLRHDESYLRWLQTYLRGRKLSEIDRHIIDDLTSEKKKEGVKASSINRILALVRAILKQAVYWNWIDTVPAVRLFPEPKRRVRWLKKEEAARLLSFLPDHQADMARFALSTGLRQGNVTGLEWSQVDIVRRMAWIHPDQAKARKAIGVPLSEEAVEVVRRQIGKHERFVFSYGGHPIKNVTTKSWYGALKKAGIRNFRWHDLRHTWASWHVQAGTPLHVLQELGGWESSEMVRRYAHLSSDHLAAYVENARHGTSTAQDTVKTEERMILNA